MVTLRDGANRPLREKTVFFVVSGSQGTYAVSAITDYEGKAVLESVPLPGGTYALNVYFMGVIPLPGQTVTLDDVRYLPSSATSEVTLPNTPPVADAGGPYEAKEGSPVVLDASASSDPEDGALQYRWDFDNDGIWDTGWSDSPTASWTWDDDWSGIARLEVSDGELTDTDSASVVVNNVPPVVTADPAIQEVQYS